MKINSKTNITHHTSKQFINQKQQNTKPDQKSTAHTHKKKKQKTSTTPPLAVVGRRLGVVESGAQKQLLLSQHFQSLSLLHWRRRQDMVFFSRKVAGSIPAAMPRKKRKFFTPKNMRNLASRTRTKKGNSPCPRISKISHQNQASIESKRYHCKVTPIRYREKKSVGKWHTQNLIGVPDIVGDM